MHPVLARSSRLAIYIGIWVPLGAALASLLALQRVLAWPPALAFALPLAIGFGFLCLSSYYASHGLPSSHEDLPRAVVTAVAAAFVSSALWLLLARGWLAAVASIGTWQIPATAFHAAAPTLFWFGFLLYLLAFAISFLSRTFEVAREAERRGLELQVLAREAELRALRAQLDPHFLFNSLQSISALTTADPPAARRMCLLLADFLRDTLTVGALSRIPLRRELLLAERYLEIEQVRFGDRLRVEIDRGPGDPLVPPLILQPLVENAVTHGIAHVLKGGIVRIRASAGSTRLVLSVENPVDADRPRGKGTGLGLANVRDRLRSAYGATDVRLDLSEHDGTFRAQLELPLVL
jgi:two-component system, LytTR family, sensor histidine kinase AlgZ